MLSSALFFEKSLRFLHMPQLEVIVSLVKGSTILFHSQIFQCVKNGIVGLIEIQFACGFFGTCGSQRLASMGSQLQR